MNIAQALTEHKTQSRQKAIEIAHYAAKSEANFKELMQCFLSNDYRLAQRAAWAVNFAWEQNPGILTPYLPVLAAQLGRTDVHDAVIRNSARILEKTTIPEALEGTVMQACFTLVEKPATPVAIKVFCFTILCNLAEKHTALKPELQVLAEEISRYETIAFKARLKHLKLFKRNGN